MLELLFALLLQLSSLQSDAGKPVTAEKSATDKQTTISTNRSGNGNTGQRIGSGGWDDKN